MNPTLMNKILKAVARARAKHPHFADDRNHALALAIEELGELAQAINDNRPFEEVEGEALDTIAVIVRMIEGDYKRKNNEEKEKVENGLLVM